MYITPRTKLLHLIILLTQSEAPQISRHSGNERRIRVERYVVRRQFNMEHALVEAVIEVFVVITREEFPPFHRPRYWRHAYSVGSVAPPAPRGTLRYRDGLRVCPLDELIVIRIQRLVHHALDIHSFLEEPEPVKTKCA